MADKKISALTGAATPLAGTEVLPIVQSGSTVKVAVSDLTAGRNVAVGATVGVPRTLSVGGSVALERYGATPTVALRGGTDNTVGYEYRQNITQTNGMSFSTATIGGSQTEYWFFQPNGDFRVANSNLVIGTAGKGIDFSANGGDVLSQYDEGTWNVNWNNLTGTPTSTVGRYTRIGRMVFFSYNTGAGAISGVGNSVSFSLPFTPAYASVGTMIASNVTSAGNILIWTGSLAYPETFSGSEMVFSGMFYV